MLEKTIQQVRVLHSDMKNFSKRQTRCAVRYSEFAFNICLTLYTPRDQKPRKRRKLAIFIEEQDLHTWIHLPLKMNNNLIIKNQGLYRNISYF